MLANLVRLAGAIAAVFDTRDVVVGLGLALLGVGFALVWMPLGLIVPGGVLVFAGLYIFRAEAE